MQDIKLCLIITCQADYGAKPDSKRKTGGKAQKGAKIWQRKH